MARKHRAGVRCQHERCGEVSQEIQGPPSGPLDRALRVFGDVRAGEGATVLLMSLNVFATNTRARGLYHRLGYGEETMHYVKDLRAGEHP